MRNASERYGFLSLCLACLYDPSAFIPAIIRLRKTDYKNKASTHFHNFKRCTKHLQCIALKVCFPSAELKAVVSHSFPSSHWSEPAYLPTRLMPRVPSDVCVSQLCRSLQLVYLQEFTVEHCCKCFGTVECRTAHCESLTISCGRRPTTENMLQIYTRIHTFMRSFHPYMHHL